MLWSSTAPIFNELVSNIEELLNKYQNNDITQEAFIMEIANLTAKAQNDRIEARKKAEEEFGVPEGLASVEKIEKKIAARAGEKDRKEIYKMLFPRVYSDMSNGL